MIIAITGTPGTGKTTLTKKLSKDLKAKAISGNTIIKKYKLSEGYDKEKKCTIVDVNKFSKACIDECKDKSKTFIIDSHLSHNLSKNNVKACIICKCDLKKLRKRLEKRKYSKQKIQDNLDAEIFETCFLEAQEKKHNCIIYKNKYYKKLLTEIKQL
jgi:adenylate kinase